MTAAGEKSRLDRKRLIAIAALVLAVILGVVLALTRDPVNRFLSTRIEEGLGLATVRGKRAAEAAALRDQIDAGKTRLEGRDARIAAMEAELATLRDRLTHEVERGRALSSALAGERGMALRGVETVIATRERAVERIAGRRSLAEAQARAAALPWFGTVAIASGVRDRRAEDCALLRDLDTLEEAISGTAPVAEAANIACAAGVTTADTLWAAVRNDPLAGWNALRAAGRDLPDIALEGPLQFLLDTIDGMGAWLNPAAESE